MTVLNPTRWAPANGRGYLLTTGTPPIQTQQGFDLQEENGNTLNVEPVAYQPVYNTYWVRYDGDRAKWQPSLRFPVQTYYLVTNTGLNLITNNNLNIITNNGVGVDKYPTLWDETGQ